jgi:hypothetical protein
LRKSFNNDKIAFQNQRDTLPALLLYDKQDNRAMKDSPYQEKLKYYVQDRFFLNRVLSRDYSIRTTKEREVYSNLGLSEIPEFKYESIKHRRASYAKIAQQIWNESRFDEIDLT